MTFNSAPAKCTMTVVLCVTGCCSRAVSGHSLSLGGDPSASAAETPETHEEDVPNAHPGKPLPAREGLDQFTVGACPD